MTLASRLHSGEILAMPATLMHARRGALRHTFRARADFVLLSPDFCWTPRFMGRNRFNLIAFHDIDHGGPRGHGTGSVWAWQQLAKIGITPHDGLVLALLTQPRFLGYWFNPVSFWLAIDGNSLIAVIAEVNNTFGERHSYLLSHPDHAPITETTPLCATKVFHVSPFQDIAGEYCFNFAVQPERIAIRISQIDGESGIDTAMTGPLRPLTNRAILLSVLRRPGGALRVIAQIYWQALRLKLKGAVYRKRPSPPDAEISS
ncbi:DUF1365 domain-containing protein [Celeribacter persicus]|uniref:Cyclopropane-fatty-acyl-phospholipid synthase n=1 Tax=Celeribacter persicus TaxID=1651082 RepID=A0A2T5HW94_9RHOB|nr:DUF1365 domain-containing protein [Celeribacter persicus]PTQ75856.1 hypothetical protein C8N42_101398 [Celeribacter persicus]